MNRSLPLALPLAFVLSLAGALPGLAEDTPPPQQSKLDASFELHVEGGESIPAITLLNLWGRATGRRVAWSPQAAAVRVTLSEGDHRLRRADVLSILQRVQVTALETEQDIYGAAERELQGLTRPSSELMFKEDEALPALNAFVTLTYTIRNGAGSAIYANLRGIMARDPSRVGNILYIQGPEQLVVADLAPSVELYRQLIRALDRPLPGQLVTLYQVPSARWEELKLLPVAGVRQALSADFKAKRVARIEEVRFTGADLRFKRALQEGQDATLLKFDLLTQDAGSNSPRIKISLTKITQAGQSETEIDFAAERTGSGSATAVEIRGGEEPSQLVVVVSPID